MIDVNRVQKNENYSSYLSFTLSRLRRISVEMTNKDAGITNRYAGKTRDKCFAESYRRKLKGGYLVWELN